jgi:hypothetical protein
MPSSNPALIYDVLTACGIGLKGRMLDVGFGWGKYGFLMREYSEIAGYHDVYGERKLFVTGIEIFSNYITDLQKIIYDEIILGNAIEIMKDLPTNSFDLVLLGDVLEHMTKPNAIDCVIESLRIAPLVVINTPTNDYEQGPVFDNIYESHISFLTSEDFTNLGTIEIIRQDGQGLVIRLTRQGEQTCQ